MKTRIAFIMLCLALNFHLIAQNSACDKVFNSYEGIEGFMTLNVSGNLLTEIFGDGIQNDDCSISSVKILVAQDSILNQKCNFYNEVVPNLNKKEYEELMTIKKSDQNFVVLCKKQNRKITELIIVSGGSDNSLIYVKGSLSMANAHKISQTLSNSDNF
jgi:hypothetical protein